MKVWSSDQSESPRGGREKRLSFSRLIKTNGGKSNASKWELPRGKRNHLDHNQPTVEPPSLDLELGFVFFLFLLLKKNTYDQQRL